MNEYSYQTLNVYKDAKALVIEIYRLLKSYPAEERYAICDQLRRAVISVPSNIAEGSGRTSAKDQAHFFEMAFGSLMEVNCQIDIAHDLGYISKDDVENIEKHVKSISALLSGLRRKIIGESLTH